MTLENKNWKDKNDNGGKFSQEKGKEGTFQVNGKANKNYRGGDF